MIEIRQQRGRGDTPFLHRTLEALAGAAPWAPVLLTPDERLVLLTVGALFEHDSRTGHGASHVPLEVIAELTDLPAPDLDVAVRTLVKAGLLDDSLAANTVILGADLRGIDRA